MKSDELRALKAGTIVYQVREGYIHRYRRTANAEYKRFESFYGGKWNENCSSMIAKFCMLDQKEALKVAIEQCNEIIERNKTKISDFKQQLTMLLPDAFGEATLKE